VQWQSQTGSRLLESGNDASVTKYILKLCPQFDALQAIFGQRKNVNPSFIFTSTAEYVDATEIIEVSPDDFMNAEVNCQENLSETNSFGETSSRVPEENVPAKKAKTKPKTSPLSALVAIQEKKIDLETKKLEWEMQKENKMLKLKVNEIKQKIQLK